MKAAELATLMAERVLLLDGAIGTQLQERGLPTGVCPEIWVASNPHVIQEVQRAYFAAGSDAVCSCTLGANRLKLNAYGHGDEDVSRLNERLVRLSREVAPPGGLVAGEIGPTGMLVAPFGPLPFEDAVSAFAEQVAGLVAGGADFIIIETLMDIQEARAALIAARETCELPVLVSMTYEDGGCTLTGTPPEAAAVILQSLGAFAVGCNCSTGPEQMRDAVERMRTTARVPIVAKPNAGLPVMRNGQTVFTLEPEPFAEQTADLARAGAQILGGCCGTTAAHIAELKERLHNVRPVPCRDPGRLCVASSRRVVSPEPGDPVTIIGEKINPTGKKKLRAALREGQYAEVRRLALDQVKAGAHMLDVNVGMPGIDEKATMRSVVDLLSAAVDLPLCLDSSSPEVVAAALRTYPGRALVNSVSAEKEKLRRLLPIAAKYGAALMILPLSDEGVPETAPDRAALVEQVFSQAAKYGYTKSDVVVDGLTLTISSNSQAARETLKTVAWASDVFGVNTVLGLSNVSFGLPKRGWLNATFLAMAVSHGLSMVIANPGEPTFTAVKPAADALRGRDPHCLCYVHRFSVSGAPLQAGHSGAVRSQADHDGTARSQAIHSGTARSQASHAGTARSQAIPSGASPSLGPHEGDAADLRRQAFDAIVCGDRESIEEIVHQTLAAGVQPPELVDGDLIPALAEVGDRFEKREYFLPQLMLSAEAMELAFGIVEPLMEKKAARRCGKVILATVKGDIHDIGKNIVALMMRNHGFDVVDLGKDIGPDEIIERARQEDADVVGLSALMTTTMTGMADVIAQAKASGLRARFMVGGAVVTESYAREIGADGYARDAVGAVKTARSLTGKEERNAG